MHDEPNASTATDATSGPVPLSFTRIATFVVVLSVFLGFVEAGQIYLGAAAIGEPIGWWQSVMSVMPSWWIFAALIPAVLYVSQRFPLDQDGWRRSLPVHMLAGVMFAVLHLLGTALAYHAARGQMAVLLSLSNLMRIYFVLDVLTYWAIVGGWHAVQYYRALRARELANARLTASLSEARLHALRSQLDPHFLFNTLNAVSSLASQGEARAASDVLSRLSQLLRLALDDSRSPEIPLERELEFLNLYLDIQRTRFDDRLTVQTDVAPETLGALVPTMMLQPLVENAVMHGIAARPGPGTIGVQAARDDGRLRLQIRDTGPGFPDADVIAPEHAGRGSATGHGIGLANTRARLEQLYGRNHTLELGTAPGGGAQVTIAIPFRLAGPAPVSEG